MGTTTQTSAYKRHSMHSRLSARRMPGSMAKAELCLGKLGASGLLTCSLVMVIMLAPVSTTYSLHPPPATAPSGNWTKRQPGRGGHA